jgi:hypothetical protein
MPEESCNKDCQASRTKSTINNKGIMKITNKNGSKEVDPSNIPGYYGNFKTASPSGKEEGQAHFMNVDENFSFDYSVNDDALDSVGIEDETDRSTSQQKLFFGMYYLDPWTNSNDRSRNRRALQSQGAGESTKLFNPVLCINEGDSIFFNVNSEKQMYPVYQKDSILNTNDDFDYGDFELLRDMIVKQNITVNTFSFVFKDEGIFCFENSVTGTMTIISVVNAGQTCTLSDGGDVGASMVTKESLAAIGVKSYEKTISANWWFIIMVFVFTNSTVYAVVGLFIWAHNLSQNQGKMSGKDQKSNTLYYDRLKQHDDEAHHRTLCQKICPCLAKKNTNSNKVADIEPEKKHEFAVSYKDMETLLAELHKCQDILKTQLKDREKMKGEKTEEEHRMEPIENLLKELTEMAQFVNENNEVVKMVLEDELKVESGEVEAEKARLAALKSVPDHMKNMSQLKRQVTMVIDR